MLLRWCEGCEGSVYRFMGPLLSLRTLSSRGCPCLCWAGRVGSVRSGSVSDSLCEAARRVRRTTTCVRAASWRRTGRSSRFGCVLSCSDPRFQDKCQVSLCSTWALPSSWPSAGVLSMASGSHAHQEVPSPPGRFASCIQSSLQRVLCYPSGEHSGPPPASVPLGGGSTCRGPGVGMCMEV